MKKERNFALIKNGIVENVIVADPAFIDTMKADYDAVPEVTEATGKSAFMGGEFKAGKFLPLPEADKAS